MCLHAVNSAWKEDFKLCKQMLCRGFFFHHCENIQVSKGKEKEEGLPVQADRRRKEIRMKIGSPDKSRMTGGVKMEWDVIAEEVRALRRSRRERWKTQGKLERRQKFCESHMMMGGLWSLKYHFWIETH